LKERNALVRRLDDGLAIVEGLLQQVLTTLAGAPAATPGRLGAGAERRAAHSFDLGKGTLAQISKKVDARIRLSWRNGVTRRAKAAGFLTPVGCDTWQATGITIYLENDGRLERAHGAYRPQAAFQFF
jgi:hypothetical protein